MKLLEHLCRIEAGHHYGHRFGKPVDDPHVIMNVDGNWSMFSEQIKRTIDELKRLGVRVPDDYDHEAGFCALDKF